MVTPMTHAQTMHTRINWTLRDLTQASLNVTFRKLCVPTHVTLANEGPRGSVVAENTILQARRSRVRFPMRSLDFFFFNLPILPAAL
jgi:hypothetical protein